MESLINKFYTKSIIKINRNKWQRQKGGVQESASIGNVKSVFFTESK